MAPNWVWEERASRLCRLSSTTHLGCQHKQKSMVVVAAPLVALIDDQVVSLGVDAVVISSGGWLDKMPKVCLHPLARCKMPVLCLLLQKH